MVTGCVLRCGGTVFRKNVRRGSFGYLVSWEGSWTGVVPCSVGDLDGGETFYRDVGVDVTRDCPLRR